jgi:ADP-ribose pyrophosphatase YjhB (NUDIX family)
MHEQFISGLRIDGSAAPLKVDSLQWRPSAYALIFDEAGRVLLLDNLWNGKKDFPGGGVELWETMEQGVKREVWEETGLSIHDLQIILMDEGYFLTPDDQHLHTLRFYFRAQISGGSLRNSIMEDEPSIHPHWVDPASLRPEDLTIGWNALQRATRL